MAENEAPNGVNENVSEPVAEIAASAPEAEIAPSAPTTTLSLTELKPKTKLEGKVTRIELFGAFVDIGAEVDGLLHISQIREEPVKNVNELLHVGDPVTVWVRRVDANQGRVDLTMIEMPGMLWSEIQVGQIFSGTVVRLEKFGAFVDIGAEKPGMVHVSELASGYVSAPEEVVKVGEAVTVKVIKVNSRKKLIDLSMKALEEVPTVTAESDDDEPSLSTFEFALRRAMANGGNQTFPELETIMAGVQIQNENQKKNAKREKREASNRMRKQQEDLLNRTLSSQKGKR